MTLNVKDCETSSPDGSSKSVSNLGSSINTPSRRTVITTHTSGTSSTGTAIADSLETPLLTPRTSVASSNTKQNEETPSTTSFTPQVSMTSSFATQTSLPSIQSENVPIPSTESPASSPLGSQDVATPRTLPVPIPYYGGPDTFKEVNRSPPDREHYAFHFGESREASPFTFRKMHNATPEPPRMTDHSTSGFGPVELSGGPISKNSTQMPTSGSFKATSTSTLGPSVELEQVPGSRHVLQGSNLSKYDVKDERPPNEPYFNEHFQKALQKGKYIAGNIKKTLQTCELADDRDSHVYRMIQTADELHNFDAPTVCTIGIVGDSGVGKSSLINSLLDEAGLARTAGMGRACTSVVTEYRNRKREHTAKYTIEIDCMTDDEIDEQLRELLWSYRQFHLRDREDKMVTGDELKLQEKQSKLAWDTLHAAFGNLPGSREKLTENYLQDSSDGAKERIQAQLKLWTKQLPWPAEVKQGGWLGTADTGKECSEETKNFLTGNLWPFVKVIRVFLSSQILKSGAVLADLPGLHDSNQARVKAAEAYMYKCDEIFVVADITRVDTNEGVEMILQQSLGYNLENGRPAQGIALVCTRSEDLDEDEIKATLFQEGQTAQAERIEHLEKEIADTEANASEAGALLRRDRAQDELDYLYMTARNEYISGIVRETHAHRFPNRSFSIFCVSNKTYKKTRKRVGEHEIQMKGTGIPRLRSYCHKIPARAQFRIANHFLDVRLKDLVQQVQLWLAGGSQEIMPNDRTVQKLLDTLQNELQEHVSDCISRAASAGEGYVKDIMIKPMNQNLVKWTEAAIDVYKMWRGSYHHTQIGSFCRNYGSWTLYGKNKRYWNLELIQVMVNDMSPWWDRLITDSENSFDHVKRAMDVELGKLASEVKDFRGVPLFAETIETKLQSVAYKCLEIQEKANVDLNLIEHNASGNHAGAYINEVMRPTYDECRMDRGTGVTERHLERLEQAIGSSRRPVLFKAIRNRLQKALALLNSQVTRELQVEMRQILKQIGTDIEMLRGTEAQVLAKNGDFLERLGKVVTEVEAQMIMIVEMTAAVKAEAEKNGYHLSHID